MGRTTAPTWIGTAWFGPWWLVYRGPVGPTAPHAHHALQVIAGSTVEVRIEDEPTARRAPVVVASNVTHRIVAGAADATLVYVDGDRLPVVAPPSSWQSLGEPVSWAGAARLAEAVCPPGATVGGEPAVVTAARRALADPDDGRSVEELAASLGLSASRLSHRFTETVGTTMRSYRRWQRLLLAAEAVAGGAGLTAAAHAAGFADGPHLARTFRRHFGLSVRELTAGVRWAVAT